MIILNQHINFKYNPFGGLSDMEISKVLVPKVNFEEIIFELNQQEHLVVEFLGKKGRGKTSHLKYLNQIHPSSQYFSLNKKKNQFNKIIDCNESLIIIDSIHHLSLSQRLKIYRAKKKLVISTHTPRMIEYKITKTPYKSFKFKGLKKDELNIILHNRIKLASSISHNINLNQNKISQLIKEYKDDYRSILRHLYENFENQ